MAKRGADSEPSAESHASSKKAARTVKKPKIVEEDEEPEVSEQDSSDEEIDEKPKSKNAKGKVKAPESKKKPSSSEDGPGVLKNSEGDKYIDLGKKKRATVRSFKGNTLVDIREYYGDEDQKPGKKGISLTAEQWEVLKSGASVIDKLFAEEKKKK